MSSVSGIVNKLYKTIKTDRIDWNAFDNILSGVEDINIINDEDETILTEILQDEYFYKNGSSMPDVIRHFLNHGYDVTANEGRNGGSPLSELCWTSYDKYILDAAKVLLDAKAPIEYKSIYDEPDEELSGVIGSIAWKLSGAWAVDKDYDWANTMEAYYNIAEAAKEGKDYNEISSHIDCVGRTLSGVSVISEFTNSILPENGIFKFNDSLVLWFGDMPLVVSKYITLIVDRLIVKNQEDSLQSVDEYFNEIIGSKLTKIQYVNSSMCFLNFSNGKRITFAHQSIGDEITGVVAISSDELEDIEKMKFNFIRRNHNITYSDSATAYEEEALAFIGAEDSYMLYTVPVNDRMYGLECIKVKRELLSEFNLQFPIHDQEKIDIYKTGEKATAIRIKYGTEYLYIKSSEYIGLEIALSGQLINPHDRNTYNLYFGKHIKFEIIGNDL